jgi:hypothetical protein
VRGFPISWDVSGQGIFQVFFDADGNPTGVHILGVTSRGSTQPRRMHPEGQVRVSGDPGVPHPGLVGGPSEVDHLRHQLEIEQVRRKAAEQLAAERIPPPSARLLDMIQIIAAMLAVLGASLYGAIRLGHQVYGDRLGIKPEEIGLTYASSVSRAAVILVALTAIIAFYVCGALCFAQLQNLNLPGLVRVLVTLFLFVVGAVLATASQFFANLLGPRASRLILVFFFVCAVVVWISFIVRLVGPFAVRVVRLLVGKLPWGSGRAIKEVPTSVLSGTDDENRERESVLDRLVRNVRKPINVAFLVSTLAFGSFLLAGMSARRAAERVQVGVPVDPSTGFGLLGIRAERVLVSGDLGDRLELSKRPIMYLGQADSTVVFYDPLTNTVIRLPAESAAVVAGEWPTVKTYWLRRGWAVDFDSGLIQRVRSLTRTFEGAELVWLDKDARLIRESMTSLDIEGFTLPADAASTRDACVKATATFQRASMSDILSKRMRICVHTDEGSWALLRFRKVNSSRHGATATLEVTAWSR